MRVYKAFICHSGMPFCAEYRSMSFSQAKYLWSEVMSLIFPDPKRCNTATCFIICCIPQLATFRVSLGSRAVNLEFSQDPIVGPRCAAWRQSRQRPSLVVKLRIATEYILMHAATCCNVLQRAATIATGRIKFIDSICMCAAYIYVHKML